MALSGRKHDGHQYIEEATKRGAIAVLGEKDPAELDEAPTTYIQVDNSRKALSEISDLFFEKPTENLYSVGVTGTNGKTTTAHLAYQILGSQNTELISTLSSLLRTGVKGPVTTPEAPPIHRQAFRAREEGKQNLVMETSSHALSFSRVDHVRFDCGVFTNLSRDHLDYHQSMRDYQNAKLRLFRSIPEKGWVVLNADEPFESDIRAVVNANILTYGIREEADVQATVQECDNHRSKFIVSYGGNQEVVETELFGRFNIYNSLAAYAVGLVAGISRVNIHSRLESAESVPGRMETLSLPSGGDVVIDFAHNPGALGKVLDLLSEHYRRVLVVFGCGGESDKGKRPAMGEVAERSASYSYLTNDNPKGEDPHAILRDIAEGFTCEDSYEIIPQRKEAIKKGAERLEPGEVLLIAGKGHESYQIIGDKWIEYNDKQFVKEELSAS